LVDFAALAPQALKNLDQAQLISLQANANNPIKSMSADQLMQIIENEVLFPNSPGIVTGPLQGLRESCMDRLNFLLDKGDLSSSEADTLLVKEDNCFSESMERHPKSREIQAKLKMAHRNPDISAIKRKDLPYLSAEKITTISFDDYSGMRSKKRKDLRDRIKNLKSLGVTIPDCELTQGITVQRTIPGRLKPEQLNRMINGRVVLTDSQLRKLTHAQRIQFNPNTLKMLTAEQLLALVDNPELAKTKMNADQVVTLMQHNGLFPQKKGALINPLLMHFQRVLAVQFLEHLKKGAVPVSDLKRIQNNETWRDYQSNTSAKKKADSYLAVQVRDSQELRGDLAVSGFNSNRLSKDQIERMDVNHWLVAENSNRSTLMTRVEKYNSEEYNASALKENALCYINLTHPQIQSLTDQQLTQMMEVWEKSNIYLSLVLCAALLDRLKSCQDLPDRKLVQKIAEKAGSYKAQILSITKPASDLAFSDIKPELSPAQFKDLIHRIARGEATDAQKLSLATCDLSLFSKEQKDCFQTPDGLGAVEALVQFRFLTIQNAVTLQALLGVKAQTIFALSDQAQDAGSTSVPVNKVDANQVSVLSWQQLSLFDTRPLKSEVIATMTLIQLSGLGHTKFALSVEQNQAYIARLRQLLDEGNISQISAGLIKDCQAFNTFPGDLKTAIETQCLELVDLKNQLNTKPSNSCNPAQLSIEQMYLIDLDDYKNSHDDAKEGLLVRAKQLVQKQTAYTSPPMNSLMVLYLSPESIKTLNPSSLQALLETWIEANKVPIAYDPSAEQLQALVDRRRELNKGTVEDEKLKDAIVTPLASGNKKIQYPMTVKEINSLRDKEITFLTDFWNTPGVTVTDRQLEALFLRARDLNVDASLIAHKVSDTNLKNNFLDLGTATGSLTPAQIRSTAADGYCALSPDKIVKLVQKGTPDQVKALDPKKMNYLQLKSLAENDDFRDQTKPEVEELRKKFDQYLKDRIKKGDLTVDEARALSKRYTDASNKTENNLYTASLSKAELEKELEKEKKSTLIQVSDLSREQIAAMDGTKVHSSHKKDVADRLEALKRLRPHEEALLQPDKKALNKDSDFWIRLSEAVFAITGLTVDQYQKNPKYSHLSQRLLQGGAAARLERICEDASAGRGDEREKVYQETLQKLLSDSSQKAFQDNNPSLLWGPEDLNAFVQGNPKDRTSFSEELKKQGLQKLLAAKFPEMLQQEFLGIENTADLIRSVDAVQQAGVPLSLIEFKEGSDKKILNIAELVSQYRLKDDTGGKKELIERTREEKDDLDPAHRAKESQELLKAIEKDELLKNDLLQKAKAVSVGSFLVHDHLLREGIRKQSEENDKQAKQSERELEQLQRDAKQIRSNIHPREGSSLMDAAGGDEDRSIHALVQWISGMFSLAFGLGSTIDKGRKLGEKREIAKAVQKIMEKMNSGVSPRDREHLLKILACYQERDKQGISAYTNAAQSYRNLEKYYREHLSIDGSLPKDRRKLWTVDGDFFGFKIRPSLSPVAKEEQETTKKLAQAGDQRANEIVSKKLKSLFRYLKDNDQFKINGSDGSKETLNDALANVMHKKDSSLSELLAVLKKVEEKEPRISQAINACRVFKPSRKLRDFLSEQDLKIFDPDKTSTVNLQGPSPLSPRRGS
jgi:hypothetical protein